MEGFVYTVPMALTDFIPVFLFGISGRLLMRDLYNKMPKGVFACLDLGVCVAWAKEHGVTEVTAKEMQIINDKRAKEKGKG